MRNPIALFILSIFLILTVIADVVLQIYFKFFSPYILVDDISVLTMSIIYIILVIKNRPIYYVALGTSTFLVWVFGLGIKGFGITQIQKEVKDVSALRALIMLIVLRGAIMFMCIIYTC